MAVQWAEPPDFLFAELADGDGRARGQGGAERRAAVFARGTVLVIRRAGSMGKLRVGLQML
jgi:hypothetical protein